MVGDRQCRAGPATPPPASAAPTASASPRSRRSASAVGGGTAALLPVSVGLLLLPVLAPSTSSDASCHTRSVPSILAVSRLRCCVGCCPEPCATSGSKTARRTSARCLPLMPCLRSKISRMVVQEAAFHRRRVLSRAPLMRVRPPAVERQRKGAATCSPRIRSSSLPHHPPTSGR